MWLGQQGLKIFTFLLFQMLQVCVKLKYGKEYMKKRVSDADNLQTQYYTNSVFNHFFFLSEDRTVDLVYFTCSKHNLKPRRLVPLRQE